MTIALPVGDMDRRHYLALVGSGLALSTAGCVGGDESDTQVNDMINIQHDFIPAIDVLGVRDFCEFVPTIENMSGKRLDQAIITIDLFDDSTIIENNDVRLGEIPASRNASSQTSLADFTDYSTDPEEAVTEYILRIEIVTEDGEQEEFDLNFDGADFRDRYNDREQFVEFSDHEIVFKQGGFVEITVAFENIHKNSIDRYSIHLRALDDSNVIYEDAVPFGRDIGVNARVEQEFTLSNFPDLEQMTGYEIEIRSASENSVPGEIVIEEFDKENIIDGRG